LKPHVAPFLVVLLAAGCGHYGDFELPAPSGFANISWNWQSLERPVLRPSGWDSRDVLNPVVIRFRDELVNLYSGFDGKTWHTGLALSADGIEWRKLGRVLSPAANTWEADYIAANGAAIADGGEILYWYQAGEKGRTRIGLARSRDARTWSKEPEPVLGYGPRGSWDEVSIGDPWVIRAGGYSYMYYLGQDRARRQRLGVARSEDGVRWEKSRANPVLGLGQYGAFDEAGLGEPAVWESHGQYWMLYTGRDRKEHRRMGLAQSQDGIRWKAAGLVIAGEQPWSRAVVCDATTLREGDVVRVWYGGGDRPSPDENLNGAIGLGYLRATLAK
jgi:predicted GH43/DUF377 family glycosyl hydrolase